jgi:hypothetical protein
MSMTIREMKCEASVRDSKSPRGRLELVDTAKSLQSRLDEVQSLYL